MASERGSPAYLTWLQPSIVAAALGSVAGVLADWPRTNDLLPTAGMAMLVTWPLLLVVSMACRLLWRAWQPLRVAASSSPARFVARCWVSMASLAGLVWATYAWVTAVNRFTMFQPRVVALLMPVLVGLTATAIVLLAWPLAHGVERWLLQRHVSWSVRRVSWFSMLVGVIALAMLVKLFVVPRLGYWDPAPLWHPLAALVVMGLAHTQPLRRAAWVLALVPTVAIGGALIVRVHAPLRLLDVWAGDTLGGEVVGALFDLEQLRTKIDPSSIAPKRVDATQPPTSIVLITIDTLRMDRTPLGGGPARMSALTEFAQRGTSFAWAFAPGNVTRRSLASLILGVQADRVQGRVAGWAIRLDPRHVTLAERLRAAGYETAGFMCCESFWAARHRLGFDRGLDHVVINKEAGALAEAARDYLAAPGRASRPYFVWLHLIEPHNWAQGQEIRDKDERLRRYDASLTAVDRALATLLHGMPTAPAPLVVVTSDHGEALGDHGQPFHATDLSNAQTHVPLVMVGPGIGRRVEQTVVSLVDVAPTLLELAGFAPSELGVMDGYSHAKALRGESSFGPGYAYLAMIADRSVSESASALVMGRYKLLARVRGVELYDIVADPGELRDLARQQPALVHALMPYLQTAKAHGASLPFAPLR